jgi:hypothetical protein
MILLGELTGKTLGGKQYIVMDEKLTQFDLTVYEQLESISSNYKVIDTEYADLSIIEKKIIADYS